MSATKYELTISCFLFHAFHYEIFLLSFAATHLSFLKINSPIHSFYLIFFPFSNIPKIHLYSFTCYKPVYLFGNLHLNNNFRPILSKCLNLILKFETTHFHNFIKCLIVVFNFFFLKIHILKTLYFKNVPLKNNLSKWTLSSNFVSQK